MNTLCYICGDKVCKCPREQSEVRASLSVSRYVALALGLCARLERGMRDKRLTIQTQFRCRPTGYVITKAPENMIVNEITSGKSKGLNIIAAFGPLGASSFARGNDVPIPAPVLDVGEELNVIVSTEAAGVLESYFIVQSYFIVLDLTKHPVSP